MLIRPFGGASGRIIRAREDFVRTGMMPERFEENRRQF
jgi:hypothetical protein